MTPTTIYTVKDGRLTAMTPSAPETKDSMQRLIADHPELISDGDGPLLLIRREQPIADGEEAAGRWSLDHLFVTRDGVPVLVELKRASDTRLRREVVGQMLDYAANGTAYWKSGTIAASFAQASAAAGRDPDAVLLDFLGEDADPDAFWRRVDDSFAAGRVKLVFVADKIPRELARIVEFLNEQMKADVRAVELNWFEGDGVTALSPRIIGETERAATAKAASAGLLPPLTRDEWIAKHLAPFGPETVRAAEHFVSVVEQAGGHAEVTKAQGSIIAVLEVAGTSLFPLSAAYFGKGMVTLNLAYLKSCLAFSTDAARETLYHRLTTIAGPLSTKSMAGYPGFPLIRLNEADVRAGLLDMLHEIRRAIPAVASD
jgi:hypothetical protein